MRHTSSTILILLLLVLSAEAQGRWDTLASMPEMPRFYVGVAAARGRLFVVGGVATKPDGPERFAVHAYDPGTNTWETLPPAPEPMVMPNVVGVGDQLYLLGSLDVNKSFTYDFDKRTWTGRAQLPVPRLGSAAVGVNGTTIFLAGGAIRGLSGNNLNTGVRQSSLLAYDTVKDTWDTLPDLPVAVGYAAGSVIGDEFWVMGGSTNLARTDQVLVYDIRNKRWSTKAPLPVSLSSAAFATIGNHVYLTGGIATESGEISAATMVFDPVADKWSTVAPLPTPRFATHAAVIDGRLYVPTGLGMADGDPNDGPVMLPTLEVFVPAAR
jgi:hypothetical protein